MLRALLARHPHSATRPNKLARGAQLWSAEPVRRWCTVAGAVLCWIARVLGAGRLIDGPVLRQNGEVLPLVAVGRSTEVDAAVKTFVVVPADEVVNPEPGGLKVPLLQALRILHGLLPSRRRALESAEATLTLILRGTSGWPFGWLRETKGMRSVAATMPLLIIVVSTPAAAQLAPATEAELEAGRALGTALAAQSLNPIYDPFGLWSVPPPGELAVRSQWPIQVRSSGLYREYYVQLTPAELVRLRAMRETNAEYGTRVVESRIATALQRDQLRARLVIEPSQGRARAGLVLTFVSVAAGPVAPMLSAAVSIGLLLSDVASQEASLDPANPIRIAQLRENSFGSLLAVGGRFIVTEGVVAYGRDFYMVRLIFYFVQVGEEFRSLSLGAQLLRIVYRDE